MTPAQHELSTCALPEPFSSDLDYLQEELAWIELRCWRLIAQRRLERGDSPDPDHVSSKRWHDSASLSPEELRRRLGRLASRERIARRALDERLAVHRASPEHPPLMLDTLCQLYALSPFERSVVLLGAALPFSRRFDEYLSELGDERHHGGLTVDATFNFAELSMAERIRKRATFASQAPLVANEILDVEVGRRMNAPEDLLDARLCLSPRTFAQLVGQPDLMEGFLAFSSVEEPRAHLHQVVLAPEDKRRILSVVERHEDYLESRKKWGFDDIITYGKGALMLFYGPPGTGKTMMAHAVAHTMGRRVLTVDVPTFVNHADAQRFLPGLFREARLQNAILFFDECEVLFADRRKGNVLMTSLLTEIERFEGLAILATNLPESLDEALDRRILVKVHFPPPAREARRAIWQKHIPEKAPIHPDVDLDLLAARYELTGGYIKNVMLMAVAEAVHGGQDNPQITMDILERAAREQLRRPSSTTGPCLQPTARLSDVILPPALRAHVEELVDAARDRRQVLERLGIGRHLSHGHGIAALFHGPPGTGKTLLAEAIASELCRPLLVASLAALKSQWVGQTEKNLEKLFDNARAHGAVLFLDEADSLLMTRGEGRASRHDDGIVNALLTLVERHEGLVLMATNRPGSLDAALLRRLSWRLEFAMPGPRERASIWRTLLPESVPMEGAVDLEALGERYALSGGLIKQAVFRAAFRAARAGEKLTQARLEEAAQEELGPVEKRAVGFGR